MTATWEQLGRELYNARRYGEAVDAFRRALSLGTADALVRALKGGWIKGAGLDVYEREPKTEPAPTDCWNAVLLPHLGSATVTARAAMAETAAKNLIAAVEGQSPPNLVNPEAVAVRR